MGWTSSAQPEASLYPQPVGLRKKGRPAGCLQPWELDTKYQARLCTRKELQRWQWTMSSVHSKELDPALRVLEDTGKVCAWGPFCGSSKEMFAACAAKHK